MRITKIFLNTGSRQIFALSILVITVVFAGAVNTQAQDDEFDQAEFSRTKPVEDDSITFFNQGQDAHAKGELEKALIFYERALKADPDFAEAEYQRAIVLKLLGKKQDADKAFRRTISLKPDWSLPHLQLGRLLAESDRFGEAEVAFDRAITLEEENFAAYTALSSVLITANAPKTRLEKLLTDLHKLTRSTNVTAEVWIAKSVVERKLGDSDAAELSALQAVKIAANDPIALSELVEVYISKEKNEKAIETANKLISITPRSKNAKILLARSHYSNNNSTQAIAVLTSIKEPDDEVNSLINIIKANGDVSVETLEKILKSDPSNVSALGRLCIATRTTEPKKALEYCERALILDKENITHAIGFGAALVQLKRYPDAVAILQNLLRHSPENYAIHANLATALFQMENFGAAKVEYSWIIEKQPDIPIAYYFLAISLDRLQEYSEALPTYKKFLDLADIDENKLEIEKVNLRIPILENQIKRGMGKKK